MSRPKVSHDDTTSANPAPVHIPVNLPVPEADLVDAAPANSEEKLSVLEDFPPDSFLDETPPVVDVQVDTGLEAVRARKPGEEK